MEGLSEELAGPEAAPTEDILSVADDIGFTVQQGNAVVAEG